MANLVFEDRDVDVHVVAQDIVTVLRDRSISL